VAGVIPNSAMIRPASNAFCRSSEVENSRCLKLIGSRLAVSATQFRNLAGITHVNGHLFLYI
jgi:hypothetical protein